MPGETTPPPLSIAWRQAGVALALIAGAYLFVGLMLALDQQPQQMWECRDPSSSTGVTSYSTPHEGCRATVSLGERLGGGALLAVLWGPLVLARGLAAAGVG